MTTPQIIISQPWGGLGDNLQFSTLPKLYSELGFDVYISKTNAYRNPEIYDLVWKLNPYIKGESDEYPNAGSCRRLHIITNQFITNIERSHGIWENNTIYPVIYYKPNLIESFKNTLIYDSTSISSVYSDEYIKTSFTKIFEMYPDCDKKKIQFKNIANRVTPDFNTDIIVLDNIYHYCDIIYSCKVYTCLFSGCSVLASAIKQHNTSPDIHCFHNKYSDIYIFNNITYHITS
jgi:hypothetical protein